MEIPSLSAMEDHSDEVKTDPLSDVMVSGRPNLEIHVSMRAVTQESVEASVIGTASGHLVDLSMMVKMYRKP